MDDASGVRIVQGEADALKHVEQSQARVFEARLPISLPQLPEHLVEVGLADHLHRVEHRAIGSNAEIVDGDDVGVLKLSGDAGFSDQGADQGLVGLALRVQALHGHDPAEILIEGCLDHPHSPASQLLAEDVLVSLLRFFRDHLH